MDPLKKEVYRCNRNLIIVTVIISVIGGFIVYEGFGTIFGLVLTVLIFGFVGYLSYKVYVRYKDFKKSPVYLQIKRFGDDKKIINSLNRELSNEKNMLVFGTLILTDCWLINTSFLNFFIMNLNELCWVYINQTKHSVNFIPTGSSYKLIVNFLEGKERHFSLGSNSVKLLEEIYKRTPWVVIGFDEGLLYEWRKKKEEFILEVVHQREQYLK